MPLIQGKSDKSRNKNIGELISSGRDPKQAAAIAYSTQRKAEAKDSESAREHDINGWAEIKGNPISKVGVFPYSGAQISPDLEPDKVYNVFRSETELNNPETLDSFRLLPWTNEHEMLSGNSEDGLTDSAEKGVHGVIGEDVFFDDGYLKANIKIFSTELADLINSGKKELSIGYRCTYEEKSGTYKGEPYQFEQRNIRGNHLALVGEGRSGHDVAVLDSFKFTFDSKDLIMPSMKEEEKKDMGSEMEIKDEKMSIKEMREMIRKIGEHLESMSETEDDELAGEEMNKLEHEKETGEGFDEDDPQNKFVHKAEVTDEDEDEKKELSEKAAKEGDAKDGDMEKEEGDYSKSSDKGKGMDAKLRKLQKQVMDMKDSNVKSLMSEISRRDSLAKRLSAHVGVFDHSNKTVAEVASYGVKKLGLKARPGHEESVLSGYLEGKRSSSFATVSAQDSAPQSQQIANYLKGVK